MRNHRPTKKTINRINNNKSRQSIVDEANRLKSLGKMKEVIELLKNEAYLTNDEHLIFELAKTYIVTSQYDKALDELLKIEDVSTIKPFFIYCKIALCYCHIGDYSKSFDYRIKAYKADPIKDEENFRLLLNSGRKSNRLEECFSYIDEFSKIADKRTHIEILCIYETLGDFEKALNYINIYKITPENGYDNFLFAKIYYGLYDFEKADLYIEKCNYQNSEYKLLKVRIKCQICKFDECLELLDDLIKNGRNNDAAYSLLVKTYLRMGNVDDAQRILDEEYNGENQMNFQATIDIYKGNFSHARTLLEDIIKNNESKRCEALLSLVYLNLRQRRYYEVIKTADKLLNSYAKKINRAEVISLYRAIALAKVNLGIPVTGNGYYFSQIISYSKERAINHMKAHFDSTSEVGTFLPDMNLEETFDVIQNEINNMRPTRFGIKSTNDIYLLDFDEAGIIDNTVLNKMQVVVIANTKNIVTFYPVSRLSFTYETREDVKSKKEPVKRLSQIEKFNQRYGNKNNS